ncbi:Transcription factor [Penicillium occitanis (nom. inval.)]|nr:Transcription factor [Penicillium occitanis (nom. inval.)]PCG90921.1 hypothetical protein PENOC_099720 [Penicillium occitanis (nom. inval.)]
MDRDTGIDQPVQDIPDNALSPSGLADVNSQDHFSLNAVIPDVGSSYTGHIPHGHGGIPPIGDATANPHSYGHSSPARTHQSHSSHASVAMNLRSPGIRRASLEDSPNALSVPDSSIRNIIAALPSAQALQQNNHQCDNLLPPPSVERYLNQLAVWPDAIPPSVEDHLIYIYFDNANSRFPFLLRENFSTWHTAWKQRSVDPSLADMWQGFFVNMLFAVALLLDPKNPTSVSHTSQNFYDQAVSRYLPLVLKQPSRLLHAQAYLMMSLHAIFSPSTEQIVLMISSTIRYCIIAQFHLAEAEPKPIDDATRIEIQMRRRAFWVAYGLDRLACGVLRIPLSIADDNITVPLISQFSVGITILYCLWSTPLKYRSDAYNSKRVMEAIRACSNNILIMAERWERAKDLLDVFEVLATEVPLVETADSHGGRAINRISSDAADDICGKLTNVKSMVLNREIIRMIQEMITEDLPEADDNATIEAFASLGDKVTLDPAFSNNNSNTPSYQFPNLYFSSNPSSSEIGTLLMGQTLEFPDTLPDYDVY